MSIPGAASPLFLAATAAAGPAGDFSIAKSLRFNSADSANLSRTPSSASNRKTFTFSAWVKRSKLALGSQYYPRLLATARTSGTCEFNFMDNDALRLQLSEGSAVTNQVFRDCSSWYHIVLAVDTTQASNADRIKMYVNGSQVTDFASYPTITQNSDTAVNAAQSHVIGYYVHGGGQYLDGYLTEINFVDGSALDPTSFGQADSDGVWRPKDTAGLTFGTNGFRLKFADNSSNAALGTDSSGQSNTWTVNNLSAVVAVANVGFDVVLYNGTASSQSISGLQFKPDLVWLKRRNGAGNNNIQDAVRGASTYLQSDYNGAETSSGSRLASFDSNGFTLTSDNGGNASGGTYVAWAWNAGANSNKTYTVKVVSDSGNKYRFDDFGTSAVTLDLAEGSTYIFDQSDSSNSGHPIRFGTSANGTNYTTGVTHTGTPGSAGAKTTLVLASGAATLYYSCLNHSGMGGQINTNSTAGASNFDGSIQSTIKANQTYGFSVVTWSGIGPGSAGTVGHGLSSAPKFIISKSRTLTDNWGCYHESLGNTKDIFLNSTNAARTYPTWNNTTPTSSVFSVGQTGQTNESGHTYIGYVWSEVPGFSKFGSYTGNGSTTGPTITTGFKPGFILIKATSISGEDWVIIDLKRSPSNPSKNLIKANSADNEYTHGNAYDTDINSDGFQVKNNNPRWNQNGATYIYAAFADTGLTPGDIDSLVDTPTNAAEPSDTGVGNEVIGNYATLNPLQKSSGSTLTNGNLDISMSGSQGTTFATMPFPASGKWYFECTANSSQGDVGIAKASADLSQYVGKNSNSYGYYIDGNVYHNDSSAGSGASYGNGDIIGVAFDSDAGTCKWYKNNALQVTISSLTGEWFPAFGSGNAAGIFNFGSRAFSYTAPSNHKSLNTANLPTPTIADGSKYFDTKLWTGSGSSRSITGYSFSPDWVWIKPRNAAYNNALFDIVRGSGKRLKSNDTVDEDTDNNTLSGFASDGFTLGTNNGVNQSSKTYVGWAWDAGTGSPVTNNDGSIASQVRAQPSAGFSICTYTGNGTGGASIGHGLNAAVEFLIVKDRSAAASWHIQHSAIGNTSAIFLNSTAAAVSNGAYWNNTSPTNSVFTVGTADGMNGSGNTYVAYCFAPVAGYSAMGSYEGLGTAGGAFVFLGFRPALLIVKDVDGTWDWYMYDTARNTYNVVNNVLRPSQNYVEEGHATNNTFDFLSNGFKVRGATSQSEPTNYSGHTYIYYAVAENPFQANGGLAR